MVVVVALTTTTSLLTACQSESQPSSAIEWFETMVDVEPAAFQEIQHFTIQDIDFSHHFKFTYIDRADLDIIIQKQVLKPDSNVTGLDSNLLPPWFTPSPNMQSYSDFNRSNAAVILWIDEASKTAYFEYVQI